MFTQLMSLMMFENSSVTLGAYLSTRAKISSILTEGTLCLCISMHPAHPEGVFVMSGVSDVHTAAHHKQNIQQAVEFVENAALCWRIVVHLILSTDLKILLQKTWKRRIKVYARNLD